MRIQAEGVVLVRSHSCGNPDAQWVLWRDFGLREASDGPILALASCQKVRGGKYAMRTLASWQVKTTRAHGSPATPRHGTDTATTAPRARCDQASMPVRHQRARGALRSDARLMHMQQHVFLFGVQGRTHCGPTTWFDSTGGTGQCATLHMDTRWTRQSSA